MAPSLKGKEKVIDGNGSKCNNANRKRKRSVIQFFENAVDVNEDDTSDDSLFIDDLLGDEFAGSGSASDSNLLNDHQRAHFVPFVHKEEQITMGENKKRLEEHYRPASSFVKYSKDSYGNKRSREKSTYLPSSKDPVIWKVECMVGKERSSAVSLMKKYVSSEYKGTKLQIISAFALDHVKGFIYIEAEKQSDIYEACKDFSCIYSTHVEPAPKDEISHLCSVQSKGNGISEGMWARVKSGSYKGDLAQVVAVNGTRKEVTIKLIPRIDLQAVALKFGRGIKPRKALKPVARLLSSSELEVFRPLIKYKHDREMNGTFQILDGLMLKDGYLYKKVSVESLNFWRVTPTKNELVMFKTPENDDSNDLEKGRRKGEGSSNFIMRNKFEVHDLVFFGRKDFGVIIDSEKENSFKIIKEGKEGPVTVTVHICHLKKADFDNELFTALDQQLKIISVDDSVRVLDGPLKGKQGVVKKIYRGIVFLYNKTEEANNGYICTKAIFCENSGEAGSSGFGDFSSSRSPRSLQESQFNRDDSAMFSIGQLLRIRLGPLKGYLCRVLEVRDSDVTVKLDCQNNLLRVKFEYLSEVHGKSSSISTGVDTDSVKSFDLLEVQDGSREWMDGAATATTTGGSGNSGVLSTERSSLPAFPASNSSLQQESASPFPPKSVDEDANKGDCSSEVKATPRWGSSRGAAGAAHETFAGMEQVAASSSQNKAASVTGYLNGALDSWVKAVMSGYPTTCEWLENDSCDQAAGNLNSEDDSNGNNSASNVNRDNIAMFSAGQLLRIRVGPLKGYLCRVLSAERSDFVLVKLDAQHRNLIVKCDHVSEVRDGSSEFSTGGRGANSVE